jgi:hypothetical protein
MVGYISVCTTAEIEFAIPLLAGTWGGDVFMLKLKPDPSGHAHGNSRLRNSIEPYHIAQVTRMRLSGFILVV